MNRAKAYGPRAKGWARPKPWLVALILDQPLGLMEPCPLSM